jgi:hypothetical protein
MSQEEVLPCVIGEEEPIKKYALSHPNCVGEYADLGDFYFKGVRSTTTSVAGWFGKLFQRLQSRTLSGMMLKKLYLDKWDGHLPLVMAGGNGGGLLLDMKSMGDLAAQRKGQETSDTTTAQTQQ